MNNKILKSLKTENQIKKLETKNLYLFFIITFAFSWLFWIPDALVANGIPMPLALAKFLSSPFNPAAFGPLVAALLLTLRQDGAKGVINLLKRGVDFRFKKIWLIPIFVLLPLIYGCAILLAQTSGWVMLDLTNLSNPAAIPIAFVFILFLAGPLQEEFGWRGYALDRLQARFNALTSSIIIGVFWSLWHLPAVFSNRLPVDTGLFWGFILQIILVSVLFTWVYNNTGRSILSVLLLHTMNNLSIWLVIPNMKMPLGFIIYSTLMLIIVVTIILSIWGAKKLVRQNNHS